MEIKNLDTRLQRLTDTLSHLLDGKFDAIELYEELPDDPLGQIEETVEYLVMDTKTISVANRDKEVSLLMQQEALANQQRHIEAQERELEAKAKTIARQAEAILELSTPILEVWDEIMVLPIVGVIDTRRSELVLHSLLETISNKRTKWVVIDITGVESVDTQTADHLLKMVRAARLLGTSCVLSGVRPAIAQTFIGLDIDIGELVTKRNLREALAHCLAHQRGAAG
jgi:rsbT co-antagonist protein RsbR